MALHTASGPRLILPLKIPSLWELRPRNDIQWTDGRLAAWQDLRMYVCFMLGFQLESQQRANKPLPA
jgi:hypothetical protein